MIKLNPEEPKTITTPLFHLEQLRPVVLHGGAAASP